MASLSDRIAQLESAVPRVPYSLVFPEFDRVPGSDSIALCIALEEGYWLNLMDRPVFAEMFKGERITAEQSELFKTLCPEVMATEQPKSKPWAKPR